MMEVITAKSFSDSAAKLTDAEQATVNDFVVDFQANGPQGRHALHRVVRSKNRNLWSIRVSPWLRAIACRSDGTLTLCYVANHNDAYRWAESR